MSQLESIVLSFISRQVGDWTITVHSQHGDQPHHKKHVHIRKNGLSGEYSWNVDGSRHDSHRFPGNEQCIKAAKEHASKALGVSPSIFSFICAINGGVNITLHSEYLGMPLFRAYVSQQLIFAVLSSHTGLIVVVLENEFEGFISHSIVFGSS